VAKSIQTRCAVVEPRKKPKEDLKKERRRRISSGRVVGDMGDIGKVLRRSYNLLRQRSA
jgi:hypothetical protein